jgi:exodeoxyribonuclease-3
MKLSTWNVNGIRARESQFREWINTEKADVVFVQEIKASQLQIPPVLLDLEGYCCHWHGLGGYSGVALLVKKDLCSQVDFFHPDFDFDFENRVVAARLPGFVAISMYVPNGGKDFPAKMRFLQQIEAYAANMKNEGTPLVVAGDLNVARADIFVHPKEYKPNAIGQLPEERALFERILSHDLVDLAREMHPGDDRMFTWWPPWRNMRQRNIGWRIDYILAGRSLAQRCKSVIVETAVGTSDHAPLTAVFEP